jgi:short-subunit dehydrogenase
VNNAGNAYMGTVEDTSLEEARAPLETNFVGVPGVCHALTL